MKTKSKLINEECSGEEYSECLEGKGKISFDPRFFRGR